MSYVKTASIMTLSVFFALIPQPRADEGMWLPEQLPELADRLQELGLELDVEELADLSTYPLGAIVYLGGCSASFVSPDGLVVTNHHCVGSYLEHNSTAEQNLFEQGFVATERSDELWAGPGSRVLVTESVTDVTSDVLAGVGEGISDVERYEAIDVAKKELVAACEISESYTCDVHEFYGGAEYRLVRQLTITDLRLVYVPPSSVGNYGGEIDNWMWPRHVGDFAFLRAYVGPDGLPADFSEENEPFNPTHHLEIATDGLTPSDFVMVAGFPWETSRHRTLGEMQHLAEAQGPWEVQAMVDVMEILEELMDADEDADVRLTAFWESLANWLKYNRGLLDGFGESGVLAQAEATHQAMREWFDTQGEQGAQWLQAIEELESLIAEGQQTQQRDDLVGWMNWSVDLLRAASYGYWLAVEREKQDIERDEGYQERDWETLHNRVARIENSFVLEADRQILTYWLRQAAELPPEQSVAAVETLLAGYSDSDDPIEAAVADLFERTELASPENRLALLEMSREELEASDDPLVAFAIALYPLRRGIRDADDVFEGSAARLRPSYIEALRAFSPGPLYPDANQSLRITFGSVMGYDGPDAIRYMPFTRLVGIDEKHTGEEPFNAPQELLDAIASGEYGPYADPVLDSVPVNFLSNLDTTGGNSGSATLDAHGRLCGLLFDGNYEAMPADWLFDPTNTRSIHVDIRYVLWILDRVGPAHHLLHEMGIEPAFGE